MSPGRIWRPVAALVLVVVVGCGGDRGGDEVGSGESQRPPDTLAVEFAGREGGWSMLAATDDLLVGLGQNGDDRVNLGEVVDLASGESWGLGHPGTDQPFNPDVVVGLPDELVVAGQVCPPGSRTSDAVDPCTNLAAFRVDPATSTWAAVEPPGGTTLVTDLYATAEGAVGIFLDQRGNAGPHPLFRLDDDGWVPLGEIPRSHPTCATATEVFAMVEAPGEPAPQGPGDLPEGAPTWTMTATSLVDGTARPVPVPELPRDFGSAAFGLVCGRDAPVIAMTGLGAGGASIVRLVDGTDWQEVPGIVPPEGRHIALGGASGEVAVVRVGEIVPGEYPSPPESFIAVRPDGTTVSLGDDFSDTELVPRGGHGPFVVVGPRSEPPERGVDEPPARDPVPLRLLPDLS